ncbi:MAG: hypothetical protein R3F62_05705 [Planctomycetota bacterium]
MTRHDTPQHEPYALGADRDAYLEQLIPGSDDHRYYTCLELQHQGRLDEVPAQLERWISDHGRGQRVREIERRQLLLRWDDASRETLRSELGLSFTHQPDLPGAEAVLPTALPPKLTDADWLLQETFRREGIQGLSGRALERLLDPDVRKVLGRGLQIEELRTLLQRLERPDHPRLVELVLTELEHKHSRGFGTLPIHGKLLAAQLEALAAKRPKLLDDAAFVDLNLVQLQPGPDTAWEHDAAEYEAYLERLWAFVDGLSGAFNSLKAHVLYHRLSFDRRQGRFDRTRFLSYLTLPRQTGYAHPDYLQREDHKRVIAKLGQDFRKETLLPPVHDDEELVRHLCEQVWREGDELPGLEESIQGSVLRRWRAELRILEGLGDAEENYALLNDPSGYQRLKERVDLAFALENPARFAADAPVSLAYTVKNVTRLLVKVFRINALNYALTHGREVDSDLDLDGLVAARERLVEFPDEALRRRREQLELPELQEPGTYVVELIGGGKSSRAVIRKGCLRFVERVGSAGHVLTILDEADRPLPGASVWLGGRAYPADGEGQVRIPFSERPGGRTAILRHESVVTVERLVLAEERYALQAGFHVGREQLVAEGEAEVLVRAQLTLRDTPVNLEHLQDVTLEVQATDRDGTTSSRVERELSWSHTGETVHGFKVPARLARVTFVLRGTVETTVGERQELTAIRTLSLNGVEQEPITSALHLQRTDQGYALHLLGKNGEPRPGVALTVQLYYREHSLRTVSRHKTDPQGRVTLGGLPHVLFLDAECPAAGASSRWTLARGSWELPDALQAAEGERLEVAHLGAATEPARDAVALLERRGAGYLRDLRSLVRLEDGAWVLSGLPAGDYALTLKEPGKTIPIRITRGSTVAGWAVGQKRQLERSPARRVRIAEGRCDGSTVRFRVANAGPQTRVHLLATRFVPQAQAADRLALGAAALRRTEVSPLLSDYQNGRELGDEYRYVLDRQLEPQFPGHLLTRPGLLLNPWARQDTSTELQDAKGGGAFGSAKKRKSREARAEKPPAPEPEGPSGDRLCFDFLAEPGRLRANLRPDAEGWVELARSELQGHTLVRAVAVDPRGVAAGEVALPDAPLPTKDLRQLLDFDAATPYAQRREVDVLQAGERLVIEDLATADMERYDTLRRVFDYFLAQGGAPELAEFEFLLRWPQLSQDEQRERYGKYACHELHLFLFRKDPRFFDGVVRSYLQNKLHKTFLDRWLLGEDLGRYRRSWAYGELNTLERILLGRRGGGDAVARQVGEASDLDPRDPDAEASWFRAALGSRGLAEDDLGFAAAKQVAVKAKMDSMDLSVSRRSRRSSAVPAAKAMAMSMAPPPAPAPRMDRSESMLSAGAAMPMESMEEALSEDYFDMDEMEVADEAWDDDDVERERAISLYRAPEKTQELAEQNYYRVHLREQGPGLISPNAFWADFARHQDGPFTSPHFVRATESLNEMLCALAVLDLPFEAAAPDVSFAEGRCTLTAKSPLVVFHEEIKPTQVAAEPVPILVSQNFFRADDRYRYDDDGERRDNYVRDEFLTHVVYLAQVVLTNPTSSPQKLELLLQIPRGAIPVSAGFKTRGRALYLSPYQTESVEFAFYFPAPGEFPYYPAHVAKDEALVARAEAGVLTVVVTPSKVDETSWEYVSQQGTLDQVLGYLDGHNLGRIDLTRLAWRLKERAAYERILGALEQRLTYEPLLWSYALHHGDTERAAEWLKHRDDVVQSLGAAFVSPWLQLDPVERRTYEHLEYEPLINARAHPLGGQRAILNDRFAAHYRAFLQRLRYHPQLDDRDWLEATVYLLLQDRIAEALEALARVETGRVEAGLQLDYLRAYLAFFTRELERAERIAKLHEDHPVPRWRERFERVLAHIREAEGAAPVEGDPRDRDQRQEAQASREPAFELEVSSEGARVTSRNLEALTLNLYRMDIELLFSRQPFVQQETEQFSFVEPNHTETLRLDPSGETRVALPAALDGQNLVVELVGAGRREAKVHYANRLSVQLAQGMGQLSVAAREDGTPVVGAYVKVYTRRSGGDTRFYKDGYTDHRGRFDYASLSTDDLDGAERFAILVLSSERGAVIREASPPSR